MSATVLLYILLSLVFAGVGLWFIHDLRHESKEIGLLRSYQAFPEMENDNKSAVARIVSLLEEADREFETFDDGDSFPESTYNSDVFISAVKEKLEENSDFQVRCFFNCNDPDLEFIQVFKSHPQVEIYVRTGESRPPDRHYKIIDGGERAYLSRHSLGDHARRYKEIVRASELSDKDKIRANDLLFGDLRQSVDRFERVGRT